MIIDFLKDSIPVLDRGFVRVVEYMGSDSSVVQAARVSYGNGTKTVSEDKKLLRYLWEHKHTSPFEMCEIKFHIKLPIFLARQWLRHRTANVNELSARYSIMKNEYYLPALTDIAFQSLSKKQCRETTHVRIEKANEVIDMLRASYEASYLVYLSMIDDGIARELARQVLPVSFYTEFYWKIDLMNLLSFIRLRRAPNAQLEMRRYAEAISAVIHKWCPITHSAALCI